jgi:uncharacterized protein
MKLLSFFFVFQLSIVIIAQPGNGSTTIDTIHSQVLKEDRFVWVRLPGGLQEAALLKSYPVLYVLDAEANFNTTVDILIQLGKTTGLPVFSQTIIVGIGNIWLRDRDYTPTHIVSSPLVDSMAATQSGGGEKFASFIAKELIPYINSHYPTSQKRALIGHSLGGLTVMNILLNHKDLFNGYAAIDPSMWWDDQKLVTQSKTTLSESKFDSLSLFLAIANTMTMDMADVSAIKKDTGEKTVLIRPVVVLAEYLEANKRNKLRVFWKYYKDKNHMSVYPVAASDALEFLLTN